MADVAVSVLGETLMELLIRHLKLISGAEDGLQRLKDEVDVLKDFTRDLAKMPKEDEASRQLVTEIKKVVYEVEDTIDIWLTQAAIAKNKNILRRSFLKRRTSLLKEVKSLRVMMKLIVDKVERFRSTEAFRHAESTSEPEERWTQPVKVGYGIREENIVGFEDEERTITSYLLEEKEKLDVIAITGMSGLGKTTLAGKIYNNETIRFRFPIRIWIFVSQKLNMRDILCQITKNFTSQDMSGMSVHELSRDVRLCLDEERFLLVLDDVCNLEDWKSIENILPKGNGKGKILITTRENSVAGEASGYKLGLLSDEESWKLLQLNVFRNLEECPRELESIGRVIARKCGGLPLMVVIISGVLVKSQALVEWEKVSEHVDLFLHNEPSLSATVELTYSTLPDGLRECFLYMGVFPQDYEIPSWTLIRLWIAEGFVRPRNGMSLEETATQYLNDLINRNLLMAGRIKANGEVKTCRVHNMIRMFCMNRAREQSLFEVIGDSQGGDLASELRNCRRLCVHSNIKRILSELEGRKMVRSFLYFNEGSTAVDPHFISRITDAFKLLKVLESKSLQFDRIPRGITRLFHLRYITLCIDHLETLPETFSDLWNLQTLVVDTGSRLITVKANIWRLMRLRHFKTKAAIVLNPKGKGEACENLQTLDRLSPESCTPDMCEKALNLKTLGIRGEIATLLENSSLSKLEKLEQLKLVNDLLCESAASANPLPALPQRGFFPPNLRSLTLSNTFLHWKHMSAVAMLSKLEVLKLKDNAFTGIYWKATDYQFTNLGFLLISNADVVQWEASASSFVRLKCLVLKNCENLNVIPLALGNTLEKLDINHVRKSVVDSARTVAAGKKKVKEPEKGKSTVPFNLSVGPACLAC